MKNNIFIFLFCLSAYFPKANTKSETVWLLDVTTRLQEDKRTLIDPDLHDQLTFLLKRKSHTLTLNLKRNYDIDPNADIYIMRQLNDGQSLLEKMDNVEKEDVAYYQDKENGAFMTVTCVRRSNGQCDILINGNIRIGGKNYDLRPSNIDFTSRNFLENTNRGKRYFLQDHSNIERDVSFLQDLSNIERNMPSQQDQLNIERDQSFLLDQAHIERDKTVERKDNIKKEYYVKVLVMLDSSVWDLFLSFVNSSLNITERIPMGLKNIRRYYLHIMNGVNQFYQGIDDPDITISVHLRQLIVLELMAHFPHVYSGVHIINGTKIIDGQFYLVDLKYMDLTNPTFKQFPEYDEVILFTRYTMLSTFTINRPNDGISFQNGVCVPGYRVEIVHSIDYFATTQVAAHELGHSLGADHDGEGHATACNPDDYFIMGPIRKPVHPCVPYNKNPWLFSNCSVEMFKRKLENKDCVTRKPNYTKVELDDLNKLALKLPGEEYTPNMQCQIIMGSGSVYCGLFISAASGNTACLKKEHLACGLVTMKVSFINVPTGSMALPGNICWFMYCTDPKTFKCIDKYFSSAPGTTCGINMVHTAVFHSQPIMKLEDVQGNRVSMKGY